MAYLIVLSVSVRLNSLRMKEERRQRDLDGVVRLEGKD